MWTKKGEENFDVAQGSYDSAECSDLVGLFMLSELEKRNLEAFLGLFRDDGLGASYSSCQEIDDIIHRRYGKETTLSKKIWGLKDQGWDYELSWKILERAQPFSPITGVCALCTLEKWYILFKPELATINKRDEINNHCFHKVPVLLDNT